MNPPRSFVALALLMASTACTTAPVFIDARSGAPSAMASIAERCLDQDVVFFGEIHSSDECHEQQRVLLDQLQRRHPDVVISMEMFERDVQDKLDAYLDGKLAEPDFKKQARAWPNWNHYKPIVQIAAMHRLPVIAANAPKELVRQVSKKDGGGLASVHGNPHVAREIQAPKDAYYQAFVDEMKSHMGTGGGGAMMRFYEAQVVRDETMAESIADYLDAAHKAGRHPLVLHLCGNFHSAFRRGTAARLLRRNPSLKVMVIATGEDELPDPAAGDFLVAVSKKKPAKKPAKHPTKPGTKAKAKAKAKAEEVEEEEEIDPNARPGLGFMPAYESDEEGCLVNMVVEGSAAEKAGIKKDDLIVELDGEPIEDVRAYSDVLGGLKIGSKVKVVILRDGKKLKLTAKVGISAR